MVHGRYRIIIATVAVFVALAGLMASVRGLLYDDQYVVRFGVGAMLAGVAGFVLMLNPKQKDGD